MLFYCRIDIGKTNFMVIKNQESRITLANNNSHPKKKRGNERKYRIIIIIICDSNHSNIIIYPKKSKPKKNIYILSIWNSKNHHHQCVSKHRWTWWLPNWLDHTFFLISQFFFQFLESTKEEEKSTSKNRQKNILNEMVSVIFFLPQHKASVIT